MASRKRACTSLSSPIRPGATSSKGQLGQQGDPVEGLLSVHCDIVAQRLESLAREGVVLAFDFLQADDVGAPAP